MISARRWYTVVTLLYDHDYWPHHFPSNKVFLLFTYLSYGLPSTYRFDYFFNIRSHRYRIRLQNCWFKILPNTIKTHKNCQSGNFSPYLDTLIVFNLLYNSASLTSSQLPVQRMDFLWRFPVKRRGDVRKMWSASLCRRTRWTSRSQRSGNWSRNAWS